MAAVLLPALGSGQLIHSHLLFGEERDVCNESHFELGGGESLPMASNYNLYFTLMLIPLRYGSQGRLA